MFHIVMLQSKNQLCHSSFDSWSFIDGWKESSRVLSLRNGSCKHQSICSLFSDNERIKAKNEGYLIVSQPLTCSVMCCVSPECGGDDVSWSDMRDLLQQLPDVHHSLLRYLCHFLTLVESNHKENRMTAFNLATVFGPSVFR